MAADYYGGDGEDAAPAAPESKPPEAKTEGKTDILPIAFFPDPPKPGEKCEVEIVRVHDDSVEVRYAESDEEDKREERDAEPQEASMPPGRFGDMMEA